MEKTLKNIYPLLVWKKKDSIIEHISYDYKNNWVGVSEII